MAEDDVESTGKEPPDEPAGDAETDDETDADQEPLDAGKVTGADRGLPFHKPRFHAETARKLSILLIWILAVSAAVHYLLSAAFSQWGDEKAVETLAGIFDVWLPVVAGFVGSAITYYYTREK